MSVNSIGFFDKIPKTHYDPKAECLICKDDTEESLVAHANLYKCVYHVSCIGKWLLVKNNCPSCNQAAMPKAASSDSSDDEAVSSDDSDHELPAFLALPEDDRDSDEELLP